jgi:GxxExxY protein
MDPVTADVVNGITQSVIGAAIRVHRALGPGLLESVYLACLLHELRGMGLSVRTQFPIPVRYKDVRLDCGYRVDALIDDLVIVEVKAVAEVVPIHEAQLLTYLRLAGKPAGLVINFNAKLLTHGVRRVVNGLIEQ